MDDLLKRLRANGLDECDEAIEEITRLRAQLAKADALAEAVEVLASSLPPRARQTLHAIIAACLAAQVEKRK
jgi:hypothetical protein